MALPYFKVKKLPGLHKILKGSALNRHSPLIPAGQATELAANFLRLMNGQRLVLLKWKVLH